VYQEILLAGRDIMLIVGGDSILWVHFRSAIEIIASKREALAGMINFNLHLMIEFANARSFSALPYLRDFFSLVTFIHTCEAIEPRDRVYALLGLAEGSFISEIDINYRKNIKDVYRNALVWASIYHKDLKLLSLCNSASELTWIPDLERIQHIRSMTYGRAALCLAERAYIFTKEQLLVQGVRCDYITELIRPQNS
ncbi:hypothetical protein NOF04DRAFT_1197370, partial [Fusarium oxysporum II5]